MMNGMASSSMVTALKKRVAFLERDIVSLTQAMAGYEAELRIAETPERKRDLQRLIRSCCDSVTELQQVKKRVEEAGRSF
jgi:phage shock protein A